MKVKIKKYIGIVKFFSLQTVHIIVRVFLQQIIK